MNIPSIGSNFEISGYTSVKCTGDPNKDAKNFAEANGISVDEAKKVLSGQFGAPSASNNKAASSASNVTVTTYDDEAELADDAELTDDVEFKPTGDPQEVLKTYADLKGISLDEAKAELEELYGAPKVDEADEVGEADDAATTEEGISQADIDAINTSITDLKDAHTEFKNRLNNWAISKGKYGLSELYQANINFRSKAIALNDLLGSIDMSGLEYSVRREIDDARDNLQTWTSRYEEAATYWANTNYKTKGDIWNNLCVASDQMRNAGGTLVSKLESAGL